MLRAAIVVMALVGLLAVAGGVLGAVTAGGADGFATVDTTAVAPAETEAAPSTPAPAAGAANGATNGGQVADGASGATPADTTAGGRFAAFGADADALEACVAQAGPPGSRPVGDSSTDQQIAQVIATVEQIRSLRFAAPPDIALLPHASYIARARAAAGADASYPDADASDDRRVLTALGAAPTDFGQQQTDDELIASMAGLYLDDDRQILVRANDDPPTSPRLWQPSLAHQLQHALSDDRLGLPTAVLRDRDDHDAALAARAIIEGDASLVQQQFNTVAFPSGTAPPPPAPMTAGVPQFLASTPWYLDRGWQFPSTAGMVFVCDRYLAGGWEAVNALYEQPPQSTVEVLDPDRLGTAPVDPPDTGDPGERWRARVQTTFGAAPLLWLFEAPGGERSRALDAPRDLALQWTGGELTLWRGTDADRMAVGLAVSQQQADGPLCDAMVSWYDRAFPDSTPPDGYGGVRAAFDGDDQDAIVVCDGRDVRVGIGPDLSTARLVAN